MSEIKIQTNIADIEMLNEAAEWERLQGEVDQCWLSEIEAEQLFYGYFQRQHVPELVEV